MSLKFYRSFLGCFFIFQRRIAGYVLRKRVKQTKQNIKRQAQLTGNVISYRKKLKQLLNVIIRILYYIL